MPINEPDDKSMEELIKDLENLSDDELPEMPAPIEDPTGQLSFDAGDGVREQNSEPPADSGDSPTTAEPSGGDSGGGDEPDDDADDRGSNQEPVQESVQEPVQEPQGRQVFTPTDPENPAPVHPFLRGPDDQPVPPPPPPAITPVEEPPALGGPPQEPPNVPDDARPSSDDPPPEEPPRRPAQVQPDIPDDRRSSGEPDNVSQVPQDGRGEPVGQQPSSDNQNDSSKIVEILQLILDAVEQLPQLIAQEFRVDSDG